MRNPKFVPYETIVKATSGEPKAIDEVLRHYGKRIRLASLETDRSTKTQRTHQTAAYRCPVPVPL